MALCGLVLLSHLLRINEGGEIILSFLLSECPRRRYWGPCFGQRQEESSRPWRQASSEQRVSSLVPFGSRDETRGGERTLVSCFSSFWMSSKEVKVFILIPQGFWTTGSGLGSGATSLTGSGLGSGTTSLTGSGLGSGTTSLTGSGLGSGATSWAGA